MSEPAVKKQHREPLLHVAKRDEMSGQRAWSIRLITIVVTLLLIGVLSTVLTKGNFLDIYETMFLGAFGRLLEGRTSTLWSFLQDTAILLCLALAVAPAFKMRFWNCGAEGQALAGGLAAIVCMMHLSDVLPNGLLIPVVILASIAAGALWGVIPAIFKAQYGTNETLFTLMMNYIITQIVSYYVGMSSGGSQVIQPVETGALPVIGNQPYLLNILVVAVLTVIMAVYLKYSKQGYEITVVGESQNTARYVGINVKKVMIRTMLISGAVCGVAGMLLVAGTDHSINTDTVGGQGFTAIMIAWLGQLNPYIMVLMSALLTFLTRGTAKVANNAVPMLDASFSDITAGIMILALVGCEFLIHYTVRLRRTKKEGTAV